MDGKLIFDYRFNHLLPSSASDLLDVARSHGGKPDQMRRQDCRDGRDNWSRGRRGKQYDYAKQQFCRYTGPPQR